MTVFPKINGSKKREDSNLDEPKTLKLDLKFSTHDKIKRNLDMPIDTHQSTIESVPSTNPNKFMPRSKMNYYEKMKETINK